MQNEIIDAIYDILSGDATLLASGINPENGAARAVKIVGQGRLNDELPFVRITLTDSTPVDNDAEPHDFTTQLEAENTHLLVNVFSLWEPETRKIAARLTILLRHRQLTTANFNGWTWLKGTNYYTENVSDTNRIVRIAAMRVRVTMEPN